MLTLTKNQPMIFKTYMFIQAPTYTGRYLVIGEIKIEIYRMKKQIAAKEDFKYQVNLLQDQSIRQLYQNRLHHYLLQQDTREGIELEARNIQQVLTKAADLR